jgi:hypothetical protein
MEHPNDKSAIERQFTLIDQALDKGSLGCAFPANWKSSSSGNRPGAGTLVCPHVAAVARPVRFPYHP